MALAFDKVVLFGDSITQLAYDQECGFCFGPAMQNAYCRKFDVIQRGFGGYNSDHAATIIKRLVEQETTIVFFGTNDSIVPESANHVPLARYKDNLRQIVATVEQAGAKVVLVGPGPFNHHQFVAANGKDFFCDRTTLRARAYCDAAMEIGAELNVPAVPLWYLVMEDWAGKREMRYMV
ncbi:unnamed protein product [Penicillium viridicatum]